MANRKNWLKKFISCLLALSFVMLMVPTEISASVVSLETQAMQEAEYYRELIMESNSECTWNSKTTLSRTTALYDVNGNVNGYIYEYANGTTPVGFIQLDVSLGTPMIDSYSFGGEHPAVTGFREMPLTAGRNTNKLVYMSGNSYFVLGEKDRFGNVSVYDVLRKESNNAAFSTYESFCEQDIMTKQTIYNIDQRESLTRAATVYLPGYSGSGISFLTYADTPHTSNNDCGRISAVNACKYWALCRGRRSLFSSNTATYNAFATYMGVGGSNGGPERLYSGLYNFMRDQGYPVAVRGTISFADGYFEDGRVYQQWNNIVSVINNNIPVNLTYTDVSSSGIAVHAVLVIGYQEIGSNYLLFLADPYYTSVIYKSSVAMVACDTGYSSYQGWRN